MALLALMMGVGGGVSTVIGSLEAGCVEVMWLVVTGEGAVEVEGG